MLYFLLSLHTKRITFGFSSRLTMAATHRRDAAGGGSITFPPLDAAASSTDGRQTAASDLDGTLLASSSAFPYYFLVAFDSSPLRAALLLILSPAILFVYKLVSESAAIEVLIFLTFAGVRISSAEKTARSVLPRHYAADVRADAWSAFRRCGRRRLVITASPMVMVRPFVEGVLGAEVVGTELEVHAPTGRCTGRVAGGGVLVEERKREALMRAFAGESPDLGLGDRHTDRHFMAMCKEAYMVKPNRSAARTRLEDLAAKGAVFHDGRLVRRPEPAVAALTLLWLPVGFLVALLRVAAILLTPATMAKHCCRLAGVRLSVRGRAPPDGTLLVCNHRTALDRVLVSAALGRPVASVSDTGDGIAASLKNGDGAIVFPEGITSPERRVLRFHAAFARATDRIVPVAIEAREGVFHGSSLKGWKWLDPIFFFMNPRPEYDVTFLEPLRPEETCGAGGKAAPEVADRVQRMIADILGFESSVLCKRDKCLTLAGTVTADDDGAPEMEKKLQ